MHFSTDITTKSIAARVLRAYANAEPEEITALFDYIEVHGDTPTACEGVITFSKTPGMLRLTQEFNPKYYAAALYDLHCMTVQCLLRVVIGASSAAALQTYQQTGSGTGGNYAATLATHNVAWQKVCTVYGHDMPRTNMGRIEDLLKRVEAYQGHNKTRRKYLEKLGDTAFSDTAMPYHVAEPIIGTAARAIDRLDALLGESEGAHVGVHFTGELYMCYPASAQARRDGAGLLAQYARGQAMTLWPRTVLCSWRERASANAGSCTMSCTNGRRGVSTRTASTSTQGRQRHPRMRLLQRRQNAARQRRGHYRQNSHWQTWWH